MQYFGRLHDLGGMPTCIRQFRIPNPGSLVPSLKKIRARVNFTCFQILKLISSEIGCDFSKSPKFNRLEITKMHHFAQHSPASFVGKKKNNCGSSKSFKRQGISDNKIQNRNAPKTQTHDNNPQIKINVSQLSTV